MSDYPSLKKAVFGNGHVANAWCATKYGIWVGSWTALSIFIVTFILAVNLAVKIGSHIPRHGSLPDSVRRLLVKSAMVIDENFDELFLVIISFSYGVFIGHEPRAAILVPFIIIGFLAIIVAGFFTISWLEHHWPYGLRDKPVTRRIYGHCPVKMTMAPKWYQRLIDRVAW